MFGFFKKDHRHYLTRGGKHLAAERYADARLEFLEALKLCPADAAQDEREIRDGLNTAGNRLGELNLQEGKHSVNAGELNKAFDHFTLAGELAFDETIKTMAREQLKKLQQPAATAANAAPTAAPAAPAVPRYQPTTHSGSSCSSCKDPGSHHAAVEEIPEENLSEEDRFSLLVSPLPLGSRYAALGHKFAKAYLLIHDGNDAAAFPILQEMLATGEDDIVIYEVALIMYRSGKVHECEKLLNRSIQVNPGNSMSYLALIHLMLDGKRFAEAIATAERMMELGVIADQAQFMLGELYEAAGDEANAFEAFSKSLALPSVAKAAAERLIPVLDQQGRTDEAKYLAKRYLKGCC